MDKTGIDDDQVKKWYQDAANISKKYHIEGYPTLIFISPNGEITHKETGFKGVKDFISIANSAVMPGKVYVDPYADYENLVAEYRQGVKHYDRMVYMIKTALQFDVNLSKQLITDYTNYVFSLDSRELYSKENIEFLVTVLESSKDRSFRIIYDNPKKINQIMTSPSFAEGCIRSIIIKEEIDPLLSVALQQDKLGEFNWKNLHKKIRRKYNGLYADRAILESKIAAFRYEATKNNRFWNEYFVNRIQLIQKILPDSIPYQTDYMALNNFSWEIFEHSDDPNVLQIAAKWMEAVAKLRPNEAVVLDTYANLLYKIGKIDEAIAWESKALQMVVDDKNEELIMTYKAVLDKMTKSN
jgi:hypothetical protein